MITECCKRIAEDLIDNCDTRKEFLTKIVGITVSCKVDEENIDSLVNDSRCPLCNLNLKVFSYFHLFIFFVIFYKIVFRNIINYVCQYL